jgi:hypothetical protein
LLLARFLEIPVALGEELKQSQKLLGQGQQARALLKQQGEGQQVLALG